MTTPAELAGALRTYARGAPRALGEAARTLAGRITAAVAPAWEPLGAVDRWREEVRDGRRAAGATDDLLRAACYELRAHEAFREGMYAAAARDLEQAARYLLAYLDGTEAGAP